MKKFSFLLTLTCLIVISVVQPLKTAADFNPNNVADDYTFDNAGTMSVAQINNFLNSFPSSCISQNNGFSAVDPTGYSPGGGYTYGGSVSAGQVIYDAAQAYSLNPQVIITTLQKEQSLVTGTSGCSVLRYTGAVGYGCPDGGTSYSFSGVNLYSIHGNVVSSVNGTCVNSAAKAGFSQQVIHASWLLKFGEQRSEGNIGWSVIKGNWNNSDDPKTCYTGPMTQGNRQQCPSGPNVYYDGLTNIDGSSTHMDYGATAALYWYTPHFAGNQHFDAIFQTWFGATSGQGFERVISDDSNDPRQWVVYDNIKQHIPDSQTIYAWGLQNTSLITMPAAQLSAIPTGPNLDRLMRLNNGSPTVYFVDGGKRYQIGWSSLMSSWNFNGRVISGVSPGLYSMTGDGGLLPNALSDPSTGNIYMPDGANSSGQTTLRQYQNLSVFHAWEGDGANYITLDPNSGFFNQINQSIGSPLTNTTISYGGSNYQVVSGVIMVMPNSMTSFFPTPAQNISSATFNRLGYIGQVSNLLKSPSSPAVYLIDSNGVIRHILAPSLLDAWSQPGEPITYVNDAYISLLTKGSDINTFIANDGNGNSFVIDKNKRSIPSNLITAYQNANNPTTVGSGLLDLFPNGPTNTNFIKAENSPQVYLLDNSGNLRPMLWPDKLLSWGGVNSPVTQLSDYIVASMPQSPTPSVFVTDGTTNYILDNGQKWTVSSSVQNNWGLSNPQTFTDGTLNRFSTAGALGNSLRDTAGSYYIVSNKQAFVTVDPNIAGAWNISASPVFTPALVRSLLPQFMLTIFVHSNVPGDNNEYVVDKGNWYSLTTAQLYDLGNNIGLFAFMNPSAAPNTITSWPGVVIKDSAGAYVLIDGGTKRYFNNMIIQNWWTNNGSLSTITVSDNFLKLFPTANPMERVVKGTGPSVYSAQNETLSHILFPSTYNHLYAPYTHVSDALLNAMPTGSDIY